MPADHHRRKYPWELWLAGGRISLKRGRDYDVSQSTICQTVRNNASQRGLRVRLQDVGDGITIEVVGRVNALPHPDQAPIAPE